MSGWNVCEGCNLTLGFRLKPVAFLKPGHEGQTRRTDVPCPCLRLSSLPQRLDFVCAAITLAGDANVFPLRTVMDVHMATHAAAPDRLMSRL